MADPQPSTPIAALADIQIGRDLTAAEKQRACDLIDAVVGTLELHLNRALYERDVEGERRRTGKTGRLILRWYPVAEVYGLRYDTPDSATQSLTPGYDWEAVGAVAPNRFAYVDYLAGDPYPDVPWAATLKEVVVNAVKGVLLAGDKVASGVIGSYSVEGTSITYGDAVSGGGESVGRVGVADIAALARLKVPVFL